MKLGALLEDSQSVAADAREVGISGLTADSREVAPGYLFAALAGSRADGAAFIADACARGAAAILAGPEVAADSPVPVVHADNPRRALALAAARFYGRQPELVVAVTGTNGKTSVAAFVRQIWSRAGLPSASIGTLGVVTEEATRPLAHTTPDPVELHRLLRDLAEEGIDRVALEASSHGLAQYRLDGVRLAAAGFTNISRDHLDYHRSFEDYFAQKLRLFAEVLPAGGCAVVDADGDHAEAVLAAARARGLRCMSVGARGEALKLVRHTRTEAGQRLLIAGEGLAEREVELPLVGDFQAANALVAAGLAIASGLAPADTVAALAALKGAKGRLERVGAGRGGAPVFVDYAHTPVALKTVLETLRPYTQRRLIVVFGAGGDRDKGKRAQMGEVAARLADMAIVTDDNPRSENPAAIRAAILATAPGAVEIGDRRTAIAAGVRMLRGGDVLVVAGKGHESGQIVGDTVLPFSDHEAIAEALKEVRRRG